MAEKSKLTMYTLLKHIHLVSTQRDTEGRCRITEYIRDQDGKEAASGSIEGSRTPDTTPLIPWVHQNKKTKTIALTAASPRGIVW
jgi:hypothetical protein